MEIATNAVLTAVLLDVSTAVRPLGLPLETPLEAAKVNHFRVWPEYGATDVWLRSALRYEGGYSFRYGWGIIDSFETPNAYTTLQDPSGTPDVYPGGYNHVHRSRFKVVTLLSRTLRRLRMRIWFATAPLPDYGLAGER